ncbi:hypothetical protein [Roseivirga sp. E12]|uniref:hypothetical protein n=1 Tax=Roseivirga sp. E12 TaxID=2819237 RepID=UPI001ABCE426|nr:hypothetical protein [Roseivirga sp. E12]MBO3700408.1 hypothetical protein [Roseivirga sp. E12]
MLKKIKTSLLAIAIVGVSMAGSSSLKAQQAPPTGTCCPTDSGAICFVGLLYKVGYYYLTEGDCPGNGGGGSIGEN